MLETKFSILNFWFHFRDYLIVFSFFFDERGGVACTKIGKFEDFKKGNFDSLEKGNFDSLKREILTVWKGKFWQFGKGNFDSLEREILTIWKGKFWQFGKGKFWQFGKENFDSLERDIFISRKSEKLASDPNSNPPYPPDNQNPKSHERQEERQDNYISGKYQENLNMIKKFMNIVSKKI
jgi:hypothetical protein